MKLGENVPQTTVDRYERLERSLDFADDIAAAFLGMPDAFDSDENYRKFTHRFASDLPDLWGDRNRLQGKLNLLLFSCLDRD